jgi:inositol-phosphate phosphatase/L-galactose 1-phosphate phosphatase/histidinol-phosphatase
MKSTFITFAHALADAAGDVIRPHFGAHGDIEEKSDKSPVTLADKLAEKTIRKLIEQAYPDHAIYGEEEGQKKTISEYTWVIDPIDGTRAFISGRKEWGTLIALCSDGVPILGILDQPITGERWVGVKGQPTQYSIVPAQELDPRKRAQEVTIRTRTCASLADAEFSTTSLTYFTPTQAASVVKLAQACRATVKDGDCYAYGLLAKGARDLVVDVGLKPYDILALVPIIEGAGGKITAWDGEAVTLRSFANVVACGDTQSHAQALAMLT